MTIGRPVEFDRQEALETSMRLFWENGYEATSLADLLQAMGIGRQSLYNTFGDKRSLFIEAVRHYIDSNGQHLLSGLQAPGSPVANIRMTLGRVVENLAGDECKGCFVTNSIIELAPHDQEVSRLAQLMLKRTEKAFKASIDRAVEACELPGDTDARATARFLNSTVHGLVVMGKASASRSVLQDIVRIALTTLK